MKFIDECQIKVKAGKGGDGAISFRREYRVDKGGPDGGDGGRGGSIYFTGDSGVNTLVNLQYQKNIQGQDGEDGKRKNMYGVKGEDIYIKVPIGTVIYNNDKIYLDITEAKPYLIAKGGKGGRGNVKFKTSRNTAPRLSEKGDPGEKFVFKLVLKVLADIGFVGKPSAGKSTVISKISNAKPKIGDYPFTTLIPQLGIVNVAQDNSFIVADLPGLIKGAAQGKGLGIEFLKHIERCKVIAHIIDFGSTSKDPIQDYLQINKELTDYSLALESRPQLVVANKMDQSELFEKNLQKFKDKFKNINITSISALEEKNIQELKHKLYELYQKAKPIVYEIDDKEVTITLAKAVIIKKSFVGMYEMSGKEVEAIYNKIPLNSWENTQRFFNKLKRIKVWDQLRSQDIKEGDTVRIFDYEFVWSETEFE